MFSHHLLNLFFSFSSSHLSFWDSTFTFFHGSYHAFLSLSLFCLCFILDSCFMLSSYLLKFSSSVLNLLLLSCQVYFISDADFFNSIKFICVSVCVHVWVFIPTIFFLILLLFSSTFLDTQNIFISNIFIYLWSKL